MDNLKLWSLVEKTDPAFTKKVTFGRSFTAIDPQYQIKLATEQFGPFGKGWGVSQEKFEIKELGEEVFLFYKGRLFYDEEHDDDNRAWICLHSSMIINPLTKKGRKFDEDCYKKIATDALTKGLSKIGFNADVFMGKFDDSRYVQSLLQEKEKAKKAETKQKEDPYRTKQKEMHATVKEKKISPEAMKEFIFATFGKNSSKDLDIEELKKLINSIKRDDVQNYDKED